MIGIIILLLASWLSFYLFDKDNLNLLGFQPVHKRLSQFAIGFVFFFLLSAFFTIIDTLLKEIDWSIQSTNLPLLFHSLWYHTKSAITEELIFRGALLYIAIKLIGPQRGILISCAAFGVYHWFTYGLWGNVIAMLFVFLITGWMGYVWAYAYNRTKSIMWGLGGHLAWNFSRTLWFPNEPFGELILAGEIMNPTEPNGTIAYLLTGFIAPLFALIFLKQVVKNPNPLQSQ